ncbi:MAG TPA: hypothetical protein VII86_10465, partial [Thermoanaerobaculia bacterium]
KGQLTAADHVLLTAQADLAKGIGIPAAVGGTGQPLPDSDVLDAQETATIQARIVAFNAVIAQAAGDANAALVDANALLKNLATNGIVIGGIDYTSAFLTGGVFGYDGVHPTAFGYAYVASQFIDAINRQFGASIPEVDLYPFVFGPLPKSAVAPAEDLTGIVFTAEARRNLLQSLGVPKWIIDGTKPPRKPRHNHG